MNDPKQRREPTLDDVYELAKENNRMLHAMRRDAFVGGIIKFVIWIAIFIVIPYVVYVTYLEPQLQGIQSAYQQFNESAGTLSGAANDLEQLKNQVPNFSDLLNQFGGGGN